MSFKPLTAASAVLLALAATPGLVHGHAYPMIVVPPDGAALREPPREVRIQFTEGVEMEFSSIVVKNAAGEVFSQGKLRRLADDIVAVDLKPLRPGVYRVEWQVLSVDTHVTDGVLRFTVAPIK
ncbi:MAG TPA: copper resistance CopC family protein [Candidatus Binatia bacterium]|nr:copper resistance CopC family protein [Candidatus Binatia bacterium]